MTDYDRRGQKNKNKKHCSKMSTALQGLWLTERERKVGEEEGWKKKTKEGWKRQSDEEVTSCGQHLTSDKGKKRKRERELAYLT